MTKTPINRPSKPESFFGDYDSRSTRKDHHNKRLSIKQKALRVLGVVGALGGMGAAVKGAIDSRSQATQEFVTPKSAATQDIATGTHTPSPTWVKELSTPVYIGTSKASPDKTPTPKGVETKIPPKGKDKATATPIIDNMHAQGPTTSEEGLTQKYEGGITVFYNNEGLPVKYEKSDGSTVYFDVNKIHKAQEKSAQSGEPILIDSLTIPLSVNSDGPSPTPRAEHPIYPELPTDVMSEIELKKRGITIIQANNTDLHIRKNAFEPGGILAAYDGKTPRKLLIALIDDPVVSYGALKDPKYDVIRPLLESKKLDVSTYREQQMKFWTDNLEQIRGKLHDARVKGDKERYIDLMLFAQTYILELQNASDVQLSQEMYGSSSEAAGLYIPPRFKQLTSPNSFLNNFMKGNLGLDDTAVIILGTGKVDTGDVGKVDLYFDAGVLKVKSYTSKPPGADMEPKPGQSLPNPNEYPVNPDASPNKPKSYPYAAVSPGFALWHEINHDKNIVDKALRGERPDFGEYSTDINAAAGVQEAWQEYQKAKSDAKYPFVLRLPHGGGYIVTENQNGPLEKM